MTEKKKGGTLFATMLRISSTRVGTLRVAQYTTRSFATSTSNQNEMVEHFRSFMRETDVITDAETIAPFNRDWLRQYHGHSRLLLQPRSAQEVSQILTYCNEHRISVVPQGGNTGLVGGSIPVKDEVILSLLKMNEIRRLDKTSGIVTCDAGVTLQALNERVAQDQLTVPLDLGAKGSCTIGGNVATNAGGIRFLRYGTLHGTVSGLEVVLPNGEVLDSLDSLRKDNTGYDLKQLFIGAEGSLGVITGVSIQCAPMPRSVQVAMLNCETFSQVLDTFRYARSRLGEILSAFEFVDGPSYNLSLHHQCIEDPMEQQTPFYVLIETAGSKEEHDQEKLHSFLEDAMEEGLVINGTVASDSTQIETLWRIRESLSESLSKEGHVYKYDLSLPYDKFYGIVEALKERLPEELATIYSYGHVGDANIHLNIVSKEYSPEVKSIIEPWVYEYCLEWGGSVSAEHGIGQMKRNYLHYGKTEGQLNLLRQLKQMFDPNGILNPYKMFPDNTNPKE